MNPAVVGLNLPDKAGGIGPGHDPALSLGCGVSQFNTIHPQLGVGANRPLVLSILAVKVFSWFRTRDFHRKPGTPIYYLLKWTGRAGQQFIM
jgi:hypothetical protein